jgi:DNA-binding response OmpR family regulator
MTQPSPVPPAPRILVVEDDARTAELIALYLRHAGHRVATVSDGAEAATKIREEPWDLLVLDRLLPGQDGLALCRIAAETDDIPVIFVSALTLEEDRLAGFDAGGDDYLTKPFSPRELVARVHALLRRHPPTAGTVTVAGPLHLDPSDLSATVNDRPLVVTPSEFAILLALAEAPRRARTRDLLLDRLPASGGDALPRTIDVHIGNLRRKLAESHAGIAIVTVHGVGYRLNLG